MMRVGAVITSYNRRDSLRGVIERCLAAGFDDIIVVDNASSDGTAAMLAAMSHPNVHPMLLSENTGGAGGFSAGVEAFMRGSVAGEKTITPPDWICLFDDDAWPRRDAIERFRAIAAQSDETVGAIGAAVDGPDGALCEMNRQGLNPFWHLGLFLSTLLKGARAGFHLADQALGETAQAQDIDFNSFVGFFVRCNAVAQIGPPEAGLFIYGDDVLYSLALRRAGYRIVLAPNVRFVHDLKTFTSDYVFRPLWKNYYLCRNGVAVARQSTNRWLFPFAFLYYVTVWSRRGLSCKGEDRRRYFQLLRRGVWDGLRGKRGRHDELHV